MPPRPVDVRQPKRQPEDVGERRPQAEPARQPHQRVVREAVDEYFGRGVAVPGLGSEARSVGGRPRMEDPPPAARREPAEQLERGRVEPRARGRLCGEVGARARSTSLRFDVLHLAPPRAGLLAAALDQL
jgi:hypothetical protein